MSLFRIGLNITDVDIPSLEIISKLKGLYGIECIFINNQAELFLFIEDKHIYKIIRDNAHSQLSLYFKLFGIKKEDYENSEKVNSNYLESKILHFNPILLTYFDLTHLLLVNPTVSDKKNQFSGNKFTSNKFNKNIIEEISKFLQDLDLDFVLQIFCSYKKGQLLVGGQLLIFSKPRENNIVIKSIKDNLDKILLNFKIFLQTKSKFKFINKFYLKNFYNHIPLKVFPRPSNIVNDLLKVPNLVHFNDPKTELNFQPPSLVSENFNDSIPIGFKIVPGLKNPPIIRISFEELTSHFCCFGLTSQGKSRLMYNFLSFVEKTDRNFLVIDPKGEYFEALANTKKNLLYYKVGSLEFPLSLNIFSIPEGLNFDSHIQFIYSLLLSIMGDDVTPQMNRWLFKAIEHTTQNFGSMKDFVFLLEHPDILKIKGSYLEMSGNAVLNRILPLIIGPAKNCFYVKDSSINFSILSSNNVIIDLSIFELVESTISRKIFVNTFLHYFIHSIRYTNSSIRNLGDISNFIILEEIQKIAPLTFKGKNEINSFIGLAPWTVRAYGISMGFVGTDPNVETPIITNTGLNIIFYSKSNIENMLKLLGIPYSEYIKFLSELKERRRFLLNYKGDLTLVKSFDFQLPDGSSIKNKYELLINSPY